MRLRHLCLSLSAAAALVQPLAAANAEQATPEYLQQKAELEELLSKRNLELFELLFVPGKLGRIDVAAKDGSRQVFNYLTFTVRNQVATDATRTSLRAKGYNEVLLAMTQQYENAKVTSEGGAKLVIDGVEGQDGVILERTETQPRARTVSISALAFDENGTRMRLLDEVPGSGPQESFSFPDLGNARASDAIKRIKERVEEKEGRKLLSIDELRKLPLAPFDGTSRIAVEDINDPAYDMNGWFVGEAHGVLLFPKLSDAGDRFTIHVHGLCNKLRFRNGATEAGKPENYFQSRVLRRTWVLEYGRPGDEFFREQDAFVLNFSGYRWVESFQRTDIRRTSAMSKFFMAGIADDKGALNEAVHSQFWPWYSALRAANSKLPDLKAGDKE